MQEFLANSLLVSSALLCAGIAAVFDVRTRRIPNWLTAGSILIALCLQALRGWNGFGLSLLAGLLGGGVIFVFFIAGGMGAGDVKLMAAVCCFTGLRLLATVLVATALSGAVFALALAWRSGRLRLTLTNTLELLAHHRSKGLLPHPEINIAVAPTLRIPYALPILFGCAVALAQQLRGIPA